MILPIYLYGQPVLRKKAEAVPADYPDLKQLVANMYETMYKAAISEKITLLNKLKV